jgi:hypothetical protein
MSFAAYFAKRVFTVFLPTGILKFKNATFYEIPVLTFFAPARHPRQWQQ